ncbi:hypothetical protein D3C85_667800 [compost metagenome]
MAHGGEEATARLHRLLRIGARLPELVFLLFEGRDVVDDAVEDQVALLLAHEAAAHLQVAQPLCSLDLDLQIEGGQGLGVVGHLADEILQRRLGKAEHLAARLHRQQPLPAAAQDLPRPLGHIEEAPLARPLPQILIDDARHAVGDLGEAGLRLAGPRLGLLDPGHIGQHRQDPQLLAALRAIGLFGIDDVERGAIMAPAVARPLHRLAAQPHLLLLPQHLLPLQGWQVVQVIEAAIAALADEGIAIGPIAQGDAQVFVTQHHHVGQRVEQGLHEGELLVQLLLGQLALHYLAAQGPVPAHEQQHAEQEDAHPEGGPHQHSPRVDARLYGQ